MYIYVYISVLKAGSRERLCESRTAQLQELVIQVGIDTFRTSDVCLHRRSSSASSPSEPPKRSAPRPLGLGVLVAGQATARAEAAEARLLEERDLPAPEAAEKPLERPEPMSPASPSLPGLIQRAAEPEQATSPAPSARSEREDETKKSVKMLFVQCFKDDLLQERQLLMSQINNLFKLRNNGEALLYKEAGYEKLHSFLTDVPGLSLIGAGNRMELKLGDREAFANFSNELLVGCEAGPFLS